MEKCDICKTQIDNFTLCGVCCSEVGHEHDADEGYSCINCGKDGSDYLADLIDRVYDEAMGK